MQVRRLQQELVLPRLATYQVFPHECWHELLQVPVTPAMKNIVFHTINDLVTCSTKANSHIMSTTFWKQVGIMHSEILLFHRPPQDKNSAKALPDVVIWCCNVYKQLGSK
jgi:hypothetical protein